jgi:hypothetical protein
LTTSLAWLRAVAVLVALSACLASAGCGLAAAALIEAIEDGGDGDGGDGGPPVPDPRPTVVVIHAVPNATHATDVVDRLVATDSFESVGQFDAAVATPTIADLDDYDVALVVADGSFLDGVALGDVLAAFADAGGGVVNATTARPGDGLGGAWAAGDYDTIVATDVVSGDGPIGWTADLPGQSIVAGLLLEGGGTGSDRPDTLTVTSGSLLVASWNTGEPLVAVRVTQTGTRVAALGFHVVSDAVDASFVDDASSAGLLVENALLWVALEI